MSRVQLALNVSDLESAIDFYAKLLGCEPAKRRPGYANFAVVDPPLKLVLTEVAARRGEGDERALNHLGIEVETTEEVTAATGRLSGAGLSPTVEGETTCCFAVQDKIWVNDPDGVLWEVYTVLADAPSTSSGGRCCIPEAAQSVPLGVDASTSDPTSCC